jgi:hypothetical protein
MRTNLALCAMALCSVCSGCGLYANAVRNVTFDLTRLVDRPLSCVRYNRLADSAWDAVKNTLDHPPTKDYERGFKRGFVDFLRTGGPNTPPAVPPRHYWTFRYQTREGHQAMEDWIAGYTQGQSSARASGFRQLTTVVPGFAPVHAVAQTSPMVINGPLQEPATAPDLPAPRKMEPATPKGNSPPEPAMPEIPPPPAAFDLRKLEIPAPPASVDPNVATGSGIPNEQ